MNMSITPVLSRHYFLRECQNGAVRMLSNAIVLVSIIFIFLTSISEEDRIAKPSRRDNLQSVFLKMMRSTGVRKMEKFIKIEVPI